MNYLHNYKAQKKFSSLIILFAIAFFIAFFHIGTENFVLAEELNAYEQEALELLNKDRAAQGLAVLKVDMRLVRLGREHAADMIRRGYFSHVSPEGESPFDRLKKSGVRYWAAGENIALHYSVASAQESWMASPGHRANILSDKFTHAGIGVKEHKDGSLYLVQIFIMI